MNKTQILEFLEKNQGWVLQWCHGVRGSWWWLRNGENSSETLKVNGNSALAATKELRRISGDWRKTTYAP